MILKTKMMSRQRFSRKFILKLAAVAFFVWFLFLFSLIVWSTELPKIVNQKLSVSQKNFVSEVKSCFPKPQLSPEVLELHKRLNLTNPGHMGAAVNLSEIVDPEIVLAVNKSMELFKFNEFVSNLIPLDREIPDIRSEYCKAQIYSDNLPMASVVMIFHNEALSIILRSVYSVLNRTPEHLLKEIILVDDCSTLGRQLSLLFLCLDVTKLTCRQSKAAA